MARQIVGSGTAMTAMGATAGAATGDTTASFTSDPVDLLQVIYGCIHAVWLTTGTPVGTITVEATGGDFNQDRPSTTAWEDITSRLATAPPAVNGAGSWIVNIPDLGYRAIRLKYTRTSGGAANSMSVWFNGKSSA